MDKDVAASRSHGPSGGDRAGTALLKQWALDQLPVPVVVFDCQGLLAAANAAAEGVVGRTERQLLGLRPGEVEPGRLIEGAEGLERVIQRVITTGEAVPYASYILPGGLRGRALEVLLSPVKDRTGTVRGVCVAALDTTERYRARQRLTVLNDAGLRIGTTLDLTRTAEELAEVGTDHFADFITVDLLDWVHRGEEPDAAREGEMLLFRRTAQRSVLAGCPEAVITAGGTHTYHEDSPPGRALATGRASRHRVDDATLRWWAAGSPERARSLRAHGIHSLMVVPLRARGVTLGMTIFCRHRTTAPFDEDDLRLGEELAGRAAVCFDNARRYTRERATALALQRSLLPRRAPRQAAVEVASRYLPAGAGAGIGGDWFDVIPLSGARVALVVGDVVGHGVQASATMGRLRTAVRTLADVDLAPDELLTQLDDLVLRLDLEETADDGDDQAGRGTGAVGATCLYAVYDPVSRHCAMARAGHPIPGLVTPDGAVDFLELPSGPPLGLGGLPFEAAEFDIPEGSVLALYTDGLVESPGRDLDDAYALLRDLLAGPGRPLEETCERVVRALLTDRRTDDAALLLARTRSLGPERVATWRLPSDPVVVSRARELASAQLAAWHVEDATFVTELVVSELVTNAIRYGVPPIQLRLIRDTALICEVSDGSSTAPHLRRARIFDEGGRGLLLVAQLTQRWGSRHTRTGKTIWAEQALPQGETVSSEPCRGA
ncbi:SpoIIE family protein phosphatase [Streptomyces ficellus]|uniref:SpoIIE family protein phosphatase n=1 Tax=Streptomyces ficellus TaxID=1977088 RepID=A0ABT7Z9T2_9ACTN|nr:SpoIIE family protein phosphatase [Streptomyces ficellus]MDN3295811.1 SpoIIE family protein phosphatase [Streptomyces ficellus]